MSDDWPEHVRPFILSRATKVGLVSELFWISGMPSHLAWIIPAHFVPAIALGQIAFSFDAAGLPQSAVAWAYVSDEVADALAADPRRSLHISEWNEGVNLWIVGMLGRPRKSVPLLLRLFRGPLAAFARVRGHELQRDGSIGRFIDRTRRAKFVGTTPLPAGGDRR